MTIVAIESENIVNILSEVSKSNFGLFRAAGRQLLLISVTNSHSDHLALTDTA